MASNRTTKHKLIIIVSAIVLILLGIYFIPRLVIIGEYIKQNGFPEVYNDIGLSEIYEGDSIYANGRDIEISIPIHEQEIEDFYEPFKASEGITTLKGNDYEITILRSDEGFLNENEVFKEASKEHMLNSNNVIEYMIKTLDIQYKDLNVFQALDSLDEAYSHYSMKSSLLKHMGKKYCVFDDGNGYLVFAILGEATETNNSWDLLTINIYDMNNNYNLEASIEISKFVSSDSGLSDEDVRFIVLNIKIYDKGE